jgi:hypothetical protein
LRNNTFNAYYKKKEETTLSTPPHSASHKLAIYSITEIESMEKFCPLPFRDRRTGSPSSTSNKPGK